MVGVTSVTGFQWTSLIAAWQRMHSRRAIPSAPWKRVSLRNDAPALALRGPR